MKIQLWHPCLSNLPLCVGQNRHRKELLHLNFVHRPAKTHTQGDILFFYLPLILIMEILLLLCKAPLRVIVFRVVSGQVQFPAVLNQKDTIAVILFFRMFLFKRKASSAAFPASVPTASPIHAVFPAQLTNSCPLTYSAFTIFLNSIMYHCIPFFLT